MSFKRFATLGCACIFALCTLAYAAVPTPYRALTPTVFGAHSIGANIFTDAPQQRQHLHALLERSKANVETALGPLRKHPQRIIICTADPCQARFGFGTIGLALSRHAILLGPEGVNEMILTHELVHIHVKSDYRLRDYWKPRVPSWFDEGLATLISGDPRLTSFKTRDAAWIREAKDFRDWKRMTNEDTWRSTYGAAQSLVGSIAATIGMDGVRGLLAEATTQEAFTKALNQYLGPDWP